MRAWITPALHRYLAESKDSPDDVECYDRPSGDHVWLDGIGWVVPQDATDRRAASAVDAQDRLLFEVNFDQENRLRALEGKAAITRVQYRTALINRWKELNS